MSEGTHSHSHSLTCQRCHQPLILDQSISSLTPAQHALITSALPPGSPPSSSALDAQARLAALPPSAAPASRIWSDATQSSGAGPSQPSVAESFILLSESSILPPTTSSIGPGSSSSPLPIPNEHLSAHLHTILSSNTPLSHPLCMECTTLLTSEFQNRAEELTRERDAYIAFEQGIQRNRASISAQNGKRRQKQQEGLGEYDIEGDDDEWKELMNKRKELEEEEVQLMKVLEEKEKELQEALKEEESVKKEEEQVEREEDEYLLNHANLSSELSHLTSSLKTAKTHLLLSSSLLAHLERTNVYNDAFQIGHVALSSAGNSSSSSSSASGVTVGTINGLRLGGRPIVEWEEINAAWGLVALCLDRVADKVGCTFDTYKIVPLGSFSRIEELPPSKNVYELYASSDISPARLLQNRRFNYALVGLLDCIKQLVEFGKKKNKGWGRGDIQIHKDKISGYSIKLPGISSMPLGLPSMSIMGLGSTSSSSTTNANSPAQNADNTSEENWTKACKAVLAVLKRILILESESDHESRSAI